MGTEKYWQEEKRRLQMNAGNIHPDISQTFEDTKAIIPNRPAKALYSDCLQGALYIKQYALSDDLGLDDMSMLICKDVGCELQYCQASISDPYEQPFSSCDQQLRNLSNCMGMEKKRYIDAPEGRSVQEQVMFMLDKKKREKYFHLFEEQRKQLVSQEREYIMKEKKPLLTTNHKI